MPAQAALFSPNILGTSDAGPPMVEGEVVRVRYEAESGWRILVMNVGGAEETWVGVMPASPPGSRLRATGSYEHSERHGPQFKVSNAVPLRPASREGMIAWLASGTIADIGPVRARRIVETLGDDAFTVLDEHPERIEEVPGIGPALAAKIRETWGSLKIERDIQTFLLVSGASFALAKKIHAQFGARAIEVITTQPYRLALEVWGIGFKTADEIARHVGVGKDSPERAQAAVLHVLDEKASKDGHVYVPRPELIQATADLIDWPTGAIDREIDALARPRGAHGERPPRVVCETLANDVEAVYEHGLYEAERAVAEKLLRLLDTPPREREPKPGEDPPRPLAEEVDGAIAEFEAKTGLTLAPAQRQAVEMAAKHKVVVVTGGPGCGKAQPLDAKVLTPTGWRTMGSLAVGDLVIDGATGQPTRVTGVFDRGDLPVFRVTMDDDGSTLCCDEHLFFTRDRHDRRHGRPGSARTLAEIRRTLTRGRDTGANHSIPYSAPAVLMPRGPLPIDPWMLGAYLGDGNTSGASGTVQLDKPEEDVQRRFVVAALPGDKPGNINRAQTVSIVGPGWHERSATSRAIEALGLLGVPSHEKFIPDAYLYADVPSRIALLQGLCDTDGSVIVSRGHATGKAIEYRTASPWLRDGILFLVGSLGGRITWTEQETSYTDERGRHPARLSYRMTFAFPTAGLVPVSSQKHRAKWDPTPNRVSERFIRAVEPAGTAPCRCIAVEAPSHLYVTDDWIVTHNTTILRAILAVFDRGKVKVSLAAPTGRAAKRMNETTGKPASTMHSMLGWNREENTYEYTAEHPFDTEALCVDEHSMVDLRLMDSVIAALRHDARLVMMGDVDQLPSVGPGAVLSDMIASGEIPVARLTQIFRQAEGSLITANAHRINRGEPPVGAEGPDGEFYVMNRPTPEGAADAVIQMVTERIPQRFGYDPIRDVQVIVPMWKGVCGVNELNARLQAALNPDGEEIVRGGVRFRLGDKVMQTKNNRDLGVFNGDMGFIERYDDEKKALVVRIDDKPIEYPETAWDQLRLAYVSTCHKQQGSEHKCVVIAMLNAHYMMLRRQLLYTATTRGKKLVVLISDPRAIRTALAETRRGDRYTYLAGRLRESETS